MTSALRWPVNPSALIALVLVAGVRVRRRAALAAAADDDEPAAGPQRFEGAMLPAGLRAPDFSLRDQDGERLTMRSLRGSPVIVTFLYTTCEDTCPTQAQQVKGALDRAGRGRARRSRWRSTPRATTPSAPAPSCPSSG